MNGEFIPSHDDLERNEVLFPRWVYTRSFAIDGNFTASHQRQKRPEDDVPLTNGHSFMTEPVTYKEHLKVALESKSAPSTCNEFKANRKVDVAGYDATGIGAVACLRHGFFQPEATVDFQRGEQCVIELFPSAQLC